MWRLAALKEKANNSNVPLVRKLYKKQRYYLVEERLLSECHMVHLLRISGSFVDYFLQKKDKL